MATHRRVDATDWEKDLHSPPAKCGKSESVSTIWWVKGTIHGERHSASLVTGVSVVESEAGLGAILVHGTIKKPHSDLKFLCSSHCDVAFGTLMQQTSPGPLWCYYHNHEGQGNWFRIQSMSFSLCHWNFSFHCPEGTAQGRITASFPALKLPASKVWGLRVPL